MELNTINAHMLSEIVPGIGRVLSTRIVDERNRNGRYTSFEDLRRRVYGVGDKLMERLERKFIKVGDSVPLTRKQWREWKRNDGRYDPGIRIRGPRLM